MSFEQWREKTAAWDFQAVLKTDAWSRERFRALQAIPARDLMTKDLDSVIQWPKINVIENGFVFDRFADHALLYYTAGNDDSVRCVGRFLSSGLGMDSEGFGQ